MSTKFQLVLLGSALVILTGAAPRVVDASEAIEGKLLADQRGHISAQMTGERSQRVKDMYVRVGDHVKQGDRLARLDTEQLEADRLIAQRFLEEAQASVEVAQSNVARAKLEYDRKAGLKSSSSFNRADFENSEVELRAAESQLKSVQSTAKRRDAEVGRIDLEIRLSDIAAPYDGLVVEILTGVGASVTQKSPDLLTLLNLNQLDIAVQLPRDEAHRLQPGQNVEFSLADGEKHTARVRAVLPASSAQGPASVTRLQLDNIDLPLEVRRPQTVQLYLAN